MRFMTKFKIMRDRAAGWMSLVNFVSIIYLVYHSVGDKQLAVILIVLGAFGVLALTLYDYFVILPEEQEFYLQVNPEWKRRHDKNVVQK